MSEPLSPMVASMHTARNATQPSGSVIAQQARTPVPKKPMKNLIFSATSGILA